MSETEKQPRMSGVAPNDPALEIVLAEIEMISRLMTPLGRRPQSRVRGAAKDEADGADEDLFDNLPV